MLPIAYPYHKINQSLRILRPATFRERMMAQLVDGIVLGVISSLLFFLLSSGKIYSIWVAPVFPQFLLQVKPGVSAQFADWWWGGYFFSVLLPWGKTIYVSYPAPLLVGLYAAYYSFFVHRRGQTPGKMLKKLVVLSEEKRPGISLTQAGLRWLVYLMAFLPLGAGFWWGAWKEELKTLPDILTRTRVYYFEA